MEGTNTTQQPEEKKRRGGIIPWILFALSLGGNAFLFFKFNWHTCALCMSMSTIKKQSSNTILVSKSWMQLTDDSEEHIQINGFAMNPGYEYE